MLQQLVKPGPVEGRAGVGFAPRSDVAVAGDMGGRKERIGCEQRANKLGELFVLRVGVGDVVGAFELDTDREVVAGGAAAVL